MILHNIACRKNNTGITTSWLFLKCLASVSCKVRDSVFCILSRNKFHRHALDRTLEFNKLQENHDKLVSCNSIGKMMQPSIWCFKPSEYKPPQNVQTNFIDHGSLLALCSGESIFTHSRSSLLQPYLSHFWRASLLWSICFKRKW